MSIATAIPLVESTLAGEESSVEGSEIEATGSFPICTAGDEFVEVEPGGDPDLWLYRDRTVGMLRRYLRHSIEVGRLPSLLGREFFRTRVTSYTVSTFENAVIFVHDVERILDQLDDFDMKVIAKIVFQDYTQDEAARLLNCGRRTIVRRFPEVIDRISERFLDGGLLRALPRTSSNPPEGCQEGKSGSNTVSDSDERK